MGEGMPRHSDSTEKGNLFIDFDVVFPENEFLPNEKLLVSLFFVRGHPIKQNLECNRDQSYPG